MQYILLPDENIQNEINLIKSSIDNNKDIVFVYTGKKRLYDYINLLSDDDYDGLDNEYLYKLKICYERVGLELLLYKNTIKNEEKCEKNINSLSGLVKELELGYSYFVIVKNNNYDELIFIIQQLIFLNFPLDKIQVKLAKDVEKESDNVVAKVNNSEKLTHIIDSIIKKLDNHRRNIKLKKFFGKIEEFIISLENIKSNLNRISDKEIRLGLFSSKKTGKSVFTNCLLEGDIAPSSDETATPNTTIYKKSLDNKLHLKNSQFDEIFETEQELNKFIKKQFKEAEKNKETGWSIEDMIVSYTSNPKYLYSDVVLYDTPGPDAAGTSHKASFFNSLNKIDIALFLIDYTKYLTSSEFNYLEEDKNNIRINLNKLNNEKNNLTINLNKLKKEINNLKELYKNSFNKESKKFFGVLSDFNYLGDFYYNYYDNINNKIDFNDTYFELYDHFLRYIWERITKLKESNSVINGKVINSLVSDYKKYHFSIESNKAFERKMNNIGEIIINDLFKIKQKVDDKIIKFGNDLEAFSNYFGTQFKSYNIDIKIPKLIIKDYNFNYSHHTDAFYSLSIDGYNLYKDIKTAFEKTKDSILYEHIFFLIADEMKSDLILIADYWRFRKIFDDNVRSYFYRKLSSDIIPNMHSELIKIIKDPNGIFELNFNKIAVSIEQVKNYLNDLKNSFEQVKLDITDKNK